MPVSGGAGTDFARALRTLYGFMSPVRRRQLFGVVALMVVGGVAELAAIGSLLPFLSLLSGVAEPQGLGRLADGLAALGARTGSERVLAAATVFIVLAIVAGLVRLLVIWASQRFIFRLGHDLRAEVQRRILLQPYSFHLQHNSSEVLAALEKVDVLVMRVLLQLMYAAAGATIALFITATLLTIDAATALLTAASFGALYLLVSKATGWRLHRNSTITAQAYEERLRVVQESLGGIRDVLIDHSRRNSSLHSARPTAALTRLTRARSSSPLHRGSSSRRWQWSPSRSCRSSCGSARAALRPRCRFSARSESAPFACSPRFSSSMSAGPQYPPTGA
jgi:ABC-type multidrug transport system fused ATPase/permease subunit